VSCLSFVLSVLLSLLMPFGAVVTAKDNVEEKTFYIKAFQYNGYTELANQDFRNVANTYRNKPLTSWDLVALRQKLSSHIVNRGYINSGVIVPSQALEGGVLTLHIVAGVLSKINVSNNRYLSAAYIEKYIQREITSPLNINDLHRAIKLLQTNPLIKRLVTHLRPAQKKGWGSLDIKVEEVTPYSAKIEFNNHRSPSTGAEQIKLSISHFSLSGFRDILRADIGKSTGAVNAGLSYSFPVMSTDSRVKAGYEFSSAEVIEAPFDDIDIENEVERYHCRIITACDIYTGSTSFC